MQTNQLWVARECWVGVDSVQSWADCIHIN